MFTIENTDLVVGIHPKGAELQSIFSKRTELEYMWNADPAVWGKHAPVLFPIVGTLKEDSYYFGNKSYQLSRHGFAREMPFIASKQSADSLTMTLSSSDETMLKYPFPFRFDVRYALSQNSLKATYSVHNTGTEAMYFSVGGHPAFRLPLNPALKYDDYHLAFNHAEQAGRWPISKDGLIESQSLPLLSQTNRLALSKELFYKDALVFKGLSSNSVQLKSDKDTHGLEFDFTGFPYLGIWAAKNADFVCIEPWCGIADSVNTNQQLTAKEGIQKLQPAHGFERTWSVTVF